MLDELGAKVSDCVSETLEDVTPTQKEIIQYTIVQLLGEFGKMAIMFGIALYFGIAHLLLIAILSMAIYRVPAGGAHSKSHIACFLASSIIFFGNIILSKVINVPYLDVIYMAILLFNSVVIYFFAPADTEMKPVASKKQRSVLRIVSFICMVLTIVIGRFIITDLVIRNIFIFGTLIQSITMLPFMYRIFNTRYGFRDGILVPQI